VLVSGRISHTGPVLRTQSELIQGNPDDGSQEVLKYVGDCIYIVFILQYM
jgi:hypothetical protein